MTRRLVVAIVIGVTTAAVVLLTGALTASQPLSPLETARLEALAARQEVMLLQGQLALAQQTFGECAAARGRLELMVSKAVIDGKQTEFLRQYETDHPGLTWDFETRQPTKKGGR